MPTTYAIPNGRTVMDATIYTGNGATSTTIVNVDNGTVGFMPDFTWLKQRNLDLSHALYDNVRGVGSGTKLSSNATDGEGGNDNSTYGYISAINSNGFSAVRGSNGTVSYTNANGGTYVAWQWNAGSNTTSSNTNGSVTSTVSVNSTSGFSIVTFTGTGAVLTFGHGLGSTPSFVIMKTRNQGGAGYHWIVYHQNIGNTGALFLDTTAGTSTSSGYWNNTSPTSSVVTIGTAINTSGTDTFVAYCWKTIAGFSQFGDYTGNGSTDGPFIYTGFRPKFIMIKRTSGGTGSWAMYDTSRDTYNVSSKEIAANETATEYNRTEAYMDILSNGFKLRNTDNWHNVSGSNYIYATFAENPFKYANAR